MDLELSGGYPGTQTELNVFKYRHWEMQYDFGFDHIQHLGAIVSDRTSIRTRDYGRWYHYGQTLDK